MTQNQSTKVIKNFSGITSIDELTAQLDFVFAKLFDILDAKPQTAALLDVKKPVAVGKAGDMVLDYRDGLVRPMMSDGKTLQPFHHDHGAQPAQVDDGTGTGGTLDAHEVATTTTAGFMSAADKAKLDDMRIYYQSSVNRYYFEMSIPNLAGADKVVNAEFVTPPV